MKHYAWIIVICLAYFFLTIFSPTSPSQSLGLSSIQIFLIKFTVAIPITVSWIAGIVGNQELLKYSEALKDRDKQAAFNKEIGRASCRERV